MKIKTDTLWASGILGKHPIIRNDSLKNAILKADTIGVFRKCIYLQDTIYLKRSAYDSLILRMDSILTDSIYIPEHDGLSGIKGKGTIHIDASDTTKLGSLNDSLASKLALHGKADSGVISDTVKHQRLSIVTQGTGITVIRSADSFQVALYSPPVISALTNTMATNYAGQTVTGVTVSWTLTGSAITSQTLTDAGSLNIADRSHIFTDLSYTTDKYYTLSVTDGVTPTSASTWIYFYISKFYGTTTDAAPTESDIEAGTGASWEYQNAAYRALASVNVTGAGKYIFYAYPSSWGDINLYVNGFLSSWNRTTVSITNAYGDTRNYYCFTSPTTIIGTISLSAVAK